MASTRLHQFDGRLPKSIAGLPAGTPYIRLTDLLDSTDSFYDAEAILDQIQLRFSHTGNDRFDFDLVVLGELNDPPYFISDPYAEPRGAAYPVDYIGTIDSTPVQVLEIVAQNGNAFSYRPDTFDPNNDRVEIELLSGPANMTVIDTNGDGSNRTPEPL